MFNRPEINLMDELNAINKENKLKKKLQENISYMSRHYEVQKNKRLKIFKQIKDYLKYEDLDQLTIFLKKNMIVDKNMIKNSDKKIEYTGNKDFLGNIKRKIPIEDLENSKDRLTFLNQLVIMQVNGYDPIQNFIQEYRMKSLIVQERRERERHKKFKFLLMKEGGVQRNLITTIPIKKNPVRNIVKLQEIANKTGDITKNVDFLYAGLYKLPIYSKAIVFKFSLNFFQNLNKVIDLLDNDGDLLLHINFRENGKIIMNSNIENMWGKEVIIDKKIEKSTIVKILSKNDYYKILCDEKIVTFYIQRKVSKINYISINDNIRDFVFKVI